MSCGVVCIESASLWLWCRPAPTAATGPLAWELPYAAGAVLKIKKINKNKKVTTPQEVTLLNFGAA